MFVKRETQVQVTDPFSDLLLIVTGDPYGVFGVEMTPANSNFSCRIVNELPPY